MYDLDYLQSIMHTKTPLDYAKVISAEPPFHIVATDTVRGRSVTIKNFKDSYEVDRAFHASASVPMFFHPKPLLFHGRYYIDAGILDPFCLNSAIAEGCTHIVVLFSMPWRHRKVLKLVDRKLVAPYLSKINTHLAELYLNHGEYSVNGLSHVWNHFDGTHILTVAPKKCAKLPRQLTTDRKKLGHGFLAGAEAALHTFSPDEHTSKIIIENLKHELKI
jgi:predicted acylesterase/phospholipase RssA